MSMTMADPGRKAEPPRGWHAYIDGGSRGNPGDAGYGISLQDPGGRVVEEMYGYIGETTNNVAEYTALLVLLERALRKGIRNLRVYSDSELLVQQLKGSYRVKNPVLQRLHARALALMDRMTVVEVRHIPREKNRRADRLAQRAMNLRRTAGPHVPGEE